MRALIQRVSRASVSVDGEITGAIGPGLLVLLGVHKDDTTRDADFLLDKVTHLRIFNDHAGKMNLSILDVAGELLIVSQFTLYGDCKKGRRPSFDQAAAPLDAKHMYEYFLLRAGGTGLKVSSGVFQAEMQVSLTNVGPVTLLVDSDRLNS